MNLGQPARRCWAEIDLEAIRHNARVALEIAGAGSGLLAVVKADAYGHGMAAVARVLRGLARVYGVANVAEARELRAALPDAAVLILGPALPDERGEIVRCGYLPCVSGIEEAEAYGALAGAEPVPLHVVVDTGMGRMGIAEAEAGEVVAKIAKLKGVRIAAVATHLPSADDDPAFTVSQLERFAGIASKVGAPVVHALNSAGIIRFSAWPGRHPAPGPESLVRAGLMLYGVSPVPECAGRLRPALAWKTRVTVVRDVPAGHGISYGRTFFTARAMRVATLAVGYADGYSRVLSGRGMDVLLGGRRCPVLGRVTMDQIMVDATGPEGVRPGDEAVLLGGQGEEYISASEMAEKALTIPWEIFTGIQARVGRFYGGDVPSDIQ